MIPHQPSARSAPTEDGRIARRTRNRASVVNAAIELLEGGDDQPTAQQIAERAGVSLRSIFRYYADLGELFTAAMLTQLERLGPYLAFESPGPGSSLDERIDYLVHQRRNQYEHVAPTLRRAERRSHELPELADLIARVRANVATKLAALFSPELDRLAEPERSWTLAAVHNLTLLEGYENLVERHGLDPAGAAAVYRFALHRLLDPAPAAAVAPSARSTAERDVT